MNNEDINEYYIEEELVDDPDYLNSAEARVRWDDAATRFLITLYEENVRDVGPTKKHSRKEAMWSFIHEEFKKKSYEYTVKQVRTDFLH
jgi:hypothetical protein